MLFHLFIILLLNTFASNSFRLEGESEDVPELVWPTEYYLKGSEVSLSSPLVQSFEIWYSKSLNRSRKDINNGVSRTYYYGEEDGRESLKYEVHPESNEELKSEMKCYWSGNDGGIFNFLPVYADFQHLGKVTLDGDTVDKWVMNIDEGFHGLRLMLWTNNKDNNSVPIRLEIQSYTGYGDTGASRLVMVTDYWGYQPFVHEHDLDVENAFTCEENPDDDSSNSIIKNQDFYKADNTKDLNEDYISTIFDRYKLKYKKQYKHETENEERKQIFIKNFAYITERNQQNLGFNLELNQFADMTAEERKYLTGTRPSNDIISSATEEFPYSVEKMEEMMDELPEALDLRLNGIFSTVKNQGNCGSCWAFAAAATVEGVLALNNGGRNLDLSEQSLVDCAWGFDNYGCNGGELGDAFKYALKHGIPTEREYGPYLELDGYCKLVNMTEVYKIKGFGRVTPRSENAMKIALNTYGPVATAMYAGDGFSFYGNGILYDPECEGEPANHAVVIVGYGVRDGAPYWIVRNSWGEDWGEDGYILLSAKNNNCYLLDEAYYLII